MFPIAFPPILATSQTTAYLRAFQAAPELGALRVPVLVLTPGDQPSWAVTARGVGALDGDSLKSFVNQSVFSAAELMQKGQQRQAVRLVDGARSWEMKVVELDRYRVSMDFSACLRGRYRDVGFRFLQNRHLAMTVSVRERIQDGSFAECGYEIIDGPSFGDYPVIAGSYSSFFVSDASLAGLSRLLGFDELLPAGFLGAAIFESLGASPTEPLDEGVLPQEVSYAAVNRDVRLALQLTGSGLKIEIRRRDDRHSLPLDPRALRFWRFAAGLLD